MKKIKNVFKPILNARKYQGLLNGQLVTLPNGEHLKIDLSSIKKSILSISYCKYSYTSRLIGNGFEVIGVGEDDNELTALQKSLSEAFERLIYRNLKGTDLSTYSSNGWACHPQLQQAKDNAMFELLERDATLVHFLKEKSFIEIKDLPQSIKTWTTKTLMKTQFNKIYFLLSTEGFLPTVSALIADKEGKGIVTHTTGVNLIDSVEKSLVELSRITNYQRKNNFRSFSRQLHRGEENIRYTPAHHALAYSYEQKIPNWLFGSSISFGQAKDIWKLRLNSFRPEELDLKFNVLTKNPLYVVSCQSERVQDLFFGPTQFAIENKLINYGRIGEVAINMQPHFVA